MFTDKVISKAKTTHEIEPIVNYLKVVPYRHLSRARHLAGIILSFADDFADHRRLELLHCQSADVLLQLDNIVFVRSGHFFVVDVPGDLWCRIAREDH